MSVHSRKAFVGAFLEYLKEEDQSNELDAKQKDSMATAAHCLRDAFNINEEQESERPKTEQRCDLFKLFQALLVQHLRAHPPELIKMAMQLRKEGKQLMRNKLFERATQRYDRAIMLVPENPKLYTKRASALMALSNFNAVIIDCKTAISYDAAYCSAYKLLGAAYCALGKYRESSQVLQKIFELEFANRGTNPGAPLNQVVFPHTIERSIRHLAQSILEGNSDHLGMILQVASDTEQPMEE